MSNTSIENVLASFSGNIFSTYNLLKKIHKNLNFSFGIDFSSEASFPKFTNMVRNFIARELIEKPNKSGKSLILNERTVLQFIVSRKYMFHGCSMDNLKGYLFDFSLEELYKKLSQENLNEIDVIAKKEKEVIAQPIHTEPIKTDKFIHSSVCDGFYIITQDGMFGEEDLNKLKNILFKFKNKNTN